MNYRHIYHAGNFADVLKHIVLSRILAYLQKKDKAFRALDSHAGIGLYDLSCDEAQKTGEWHEGIGRLIGPAAKPLPPSVADLIAPYIDVIRSLNEETPDRIQLYPGSPKLIQMLSRPQDRSTFIELHPEDIKSLKANCGHDRRSHIRQDDGWVALRADLPPTERRGMVLVDPPFEEIGEYDRMVTEFLKGYKRWPTGTYCLWYPIKARRDIDQMAEKLAETGIDNILRADLIIHKLDTAKRLNGTGLFIVNSPYLLYEELKTLLPFLAERLGQEASRHYLEWVAKPK